MIKHIFWIIAISSFIGIFVNLIRPDGINFIYKEQVIPELIAGHEEEDGILKISLAQTIEYFNNKSAIFIDGRDSWDFREGHIPGALNFPEYKIEDFKNDLLKLDKSETYVVYCSGEDCDASVRLANFMSELGFSKLLVFEKGFDEWLTSNQTIEVENEK